MAFQLNPASFSDSENRRKKKKTFLQNALRRRIGRKTKSRKVVRSRECNEQHVANDRKRSELIYRSVTLFLNTFRPVLARVGYTHRSAAVHETLRVTRTPTRVGARVRIPYESIARVTENERDHPPGETLYARGENKTSRRRCRLRRDSRYG